MLAIEAEGLVRTFARRRLWGRGEEVTALAGLSLGIRRGELYGLLGPNGAGKTTTIRILTTLLLPSRGTARVLGHDVVREAAAVRRRIGVVYGGDRGLYGRVSALENLRYFANLYGLDRQVARRRIAELLELVGLADRAHDKVEGFSRGMKQRLHIARALLHDPEVIFLDEPTIGIDPVGARQIRQLVAALKEQGRTILLTTHYMQEADELADRVGILVGGRIVAEDTPRALRRVVPDRTVLEVEVEGLVPEEVAGLRRLPGVETVHVEIREGVQVILLQSAQGEEVLPLVTGCLGAGRVRKAVVRPPTLEDAYIRILERAAAAPGTPEREVRSA